MNKSTMRLVGGTILGLIFIVSSCTWLTWSDNPSTPAGYVGYVTQDAWFGQTRFLGLQTGPTSYGRTWLGRVINTSITPTKVTEAFSQGSEVLSQDQLKLTFAVHVLFRVRPDAVRELVEKYSTLQESKKEDPTAVAFENFIRAAAHSRAPGSGGLQGHGGLSAHHIHRVARGMT